MGVPFEEVAGALTESESESVVVVDTLIGYGLTGEVRNTARDIIDAVNRRDGPVVALDVPSGVDATTGEVLGGAVNADRIVTLALPKTGLIDRPEPIELADLGIPHTVYDRLGIDYEDHFCRDDPVPIVPQDPDTTDPAPDQG